MKAFIAVNLNPGVDSSNAQTAIRAKASELGGGCNVPARMVSRLAGGIDILVAVDSDHDYGKDLSEIGKWVDKIRQLKDGSNNYYVRTTETMMCMQDV